MSDLTPSRRRRRTTSVPGQFLGYSLQELRVAVHLFGAGDDDVVSLEVVGDSAIHKAGGDVTAEEHKSRTARGNPVADTAEDLWKTLRNWVEAVARGELDPTCTRFHLYISHPFAGDIVRRLSEANDPGAVAAAVQYARERVWRSADDASLLSSLPTRVRDHVDLIFTQYPDIFERVVARFQVDYGTGDAWADLRQSAAPAAIDAEVLEDVLRDVVGWVKQQITACIEQARPAAVAVSTFRAHLRAVRRRLDQQMMLVSVAPRPGELDIRRQLREMRVYLRQLEFIEATDDEKIEAVTDYLRAADNRVRWGASGRIHQASFEEFEEDLTAVWRRKRRATSIIHGSRPAPERGMLLFIECCGHSAKLQGIETPSHFCRGSFHVLADHEAIGWHPEYPRLLRQRKAKRSRRPHESQLSGEK